MPLGATSDSLPTDSAGNYSVAATSAHGCTDTSDAVTVTVHPLPVTGNISGNINVTEGDIETSLVTNTPGSVYQWLFTNGTGSSTSNSIDITWTTTGADSIAVIETTALGCTGDTVKLGVTISQPLGIPAANQALRLKYIRTLHRTRFILKPVE